MKLKKILETSLYVRDIIEAEKFYVDILGLEIIEKNPIRHLFLLCGDTMLLLFIAEQTKIDRGKIPTHGAIGQGHLAFGISESEFSYWEEYLPKNGITVEKKVGWEKSTRSIYFRDPSGNSLEFISENHWVNSKFNNLKIVRSGIILYTPNFEAIVDFYNNIFNFPKLFDYTWENGKLVCFNSGTSYLMIETKEVKTNNSKRLCIRFNAENLDPIREILNKFNVEFEYNTYDWGETVDFNDPDGNAISVRDEKMFRDKINSE